MENSRWIIPEINVSDVTRIMLETGFSRPIALMLAARGYTSKDQINELISPQWPREELQARLPDLPKAVTRIRHAVEHKEKILVYGDRDVDGVTATFMMVRTLQDLGADIRWYVTGEEGYGLNKEVLAAYDDVKLIITVDSGITAVSEAAYVKEKGIDLIITDHHELAGDLPQAYAIINPKNSDIQGYDRNLAGCGVSLLVAQSLMLTYSKHYFDRIAFVVHKQTHWEVCEVDHFRIMTDHYMVTDIQSIKDFTLIVTDIPGRNDLVELLNLNIADAQKRIICHAYEEDESVYALAQSWIHKQIYDDPRMMFFWETMLPFAALGCLADMVPLHGLNRCLVHHGLKYFASSQNAGIQQLNKYFKYNITETDQKITSDVFSWKYIPMLNAAGRCGKAQRTVELFLTENQHTASYLVEKIAQLNDDRKALQEENTKKFERLLEEQYDPYTHKMIFMYAQGISHGVTGIIANRLLRKYHKPVALMIEQDGMVTGTMRGIDGFDILSALDACRDILIKYGGHKKAAGFTLNAEHIADFKQRVLDLAEQQLAREDLIPSYTIDAEIEPDELDEMIIKELSYFEPFGYSWGYPVFCMRHIHFKGILPIGITGRHIKLKISSSNQTFDVVGWDMADLIQDLKKKEFWDIVIKMEINRYNGKESLRFNLQDIKPSLVESTPPHQMSVGIVP
ncbi:MAG: single-stranded-DNA-specific exonuclease RecJ [bacterium]